MFHVEQWSDDGGRAGWPAALGASSGLKRSTWNRFGVVPVRPPRPRGAGVACGVFHVEQEGTFTLGRGVRRPQGLRLAGISDAARAR